jgi:hypothetical protein
MLLTRLLQARRERRSRIAHDADDLQLTHGGTAYDEARTRARHARSRRDTAEDRH